MAAPKSKASKDSKALVLWFSEVGMGDVGIVGGKNASLGEMYQNLTEDGIRVPNGFAITAYAYHYMLKSSNLGDKIRDTLKGLDIKNIELLQRKGHLVREIIRHATLPNDLIEEITKAYKQMESMYGEYCDVAVRSSATAEDLPDASFAGQQETFLNIRGKNDLLYYCKQCFASLFTDRAIVYREEKGFDHLSIGLSIGVQKMVRSDIGSSGVMFSIDTETGFQNAVLINSAWGLGENVVQGAVNPDEFYVFKPTLMMKTKDELVEHFSNDIDIKESKEDINVNIDSKNDDDFLFKPIIRKQKGNKRIKMIYARGGSKEKTKNIKVPKHDQVKFSINDNDVLLLAKWACIIEKHYKRPMDIEWAKDGQTNELYIVQARPETVQSQKNTNMLETYHLDEIEKKAHKLITSGAPVGSKIASGNTRVILKASQIDQFKHNEILVTDMTDPDWVPIMKLASGIITNRGGRTCHAAIVSRELGIPCIVGTNNATQLIHNEQLVTMACEGEVGNVYNGQINFSIERTPLDNISLPKDTQIMMNIGNPDIAFQSSFIPNEGVGLARMEFIISGYIKIHPLALVNYSNLKNYLLNYKLKRENPKNLDIDYLEKTLNTIDEMTSDYINKEEYFIDKLSQGIGTICAAFYPKCVIVRMSDFKSNEYRNLIGGLLYEPIEDNPMIGWRGASRYYDIKYKQGFKLECDAILKVQQIYGLINIKIMIPFCRTPKEGKLVISECSKNGLIQKKFLKNNKNKLLNGIDIFVMCEIPNNVILANQFANIFDGFSIGSNDLTQLTLGVDRDSELVKHVFDERDEGVLQSIKHVIKTCKEQNIKVGICGQAPSDHPSFAMFLRRNHINSISLNPDTVIKTIVAFNKMDVSKKNNNDSQANGN